MSGKIETNSCTAGMEIRARDSFELERMNILNELTTKFPHRKWVFEIGDQFEGGDTRFRELLTQYGEVRPNTVNGRLYVEQFELYKFFQQNVSILSTLVAPKSNSILSQSFNLDKIHHVTISLLEHDKVVGFVQISYYKNLGLVSKRKVWTGDQLTEEERQNVEMFIEILKNFATEVTNSGKVRSMDKLLFDRTLIVDPEHRGKGLGAYLKLLQLMVGWLLSMENMESTDTVTNIGLTERIGAEKIAEVNSSATYKLIPEERKAEFTSSRSRYLYRYEDRERYYQNCLDIIFREPKK